MTPELFREWFTGTTPAQFFLGVAILVFGSRKIFSERNVSESLGGFALPFRWLRKAREDAAEREATELAQMRREIARLTKENLRQHRWSVDVTRKIHSIETWAASQGLELPPPPFRHLHEFPEDEDDEEDEDER